jgi:hypothetical protein
VADGSGAQSWSGSASSSIPDPAPSVPRFDPKNRHFGNWKKGEGDLGFAAVGGVGSNFPQNSSSNNFGTTSIPHSSSKGKGVGKNSGPKVVADFNVANHRSVTFTRYSEEDSLPSDTEATDLSLPPSRRDPVGEDAGSRARKILFGDIATDAATAAEMLPLPPETLTPQNRKVQNPKFVPSTSLPVPSATSPPLPTGKAKISGKKGIKRSKKSAPSSSSPPPPGTGEILYQEAADSFSAADKYFRAKIKSVELLTKLKAEMILQQTATQRKREELMEAERILVVAKIQQINPELVPQSWPSLYSPNLALINPSLAAGSANTSTAADREDREDKEDKVDEELGSSTDEDSIEEEFHFRYNLLD